jgi:hypothetical protein
MDWINWNAVPSWTDMVGLLGTALSVWAAYAAFRKAKAIEAASRATKKKLAKNSLRDYLEALKRLSTHLDTATAVDDRQGARYILLWIAQESSRAAELLLHTDVEDAVTGNDGVKLTVQLGILAEAAAQAKHDLYSKQTAKVDRIAKPVQALMGQLGPSLEAITTRISHGLETANAE